MSAFAKNQDCTISEGNVGNVDDLKGLRYERPLLLGHCILCNNIFVLITFFARNFKTVVQSTDLTVTLTSGGNIQLL